MTSMVKESRRAISADVEYSTFYIGEQLVGIDIQKVQEINRMLEFTRVHHAPRCVKGVANLRGEVVTVVDPRVILGLDPIELAVDSRNVIVTSRNERIGLLVDRIGDVVSVSTDAIEPPPANAGGLDGRFFKGVITLESELLVVLDTEEILSAGDTDHHKE